MKIAIVDIDSILWSMDAPWYKELIKINPECPYPGKLPIWDFYKGYISDSDFKKTIDIIHMQQDKYPCFVDAPELTNMLHDAGFYVKIASHRTAKSKEATATWLHNNNIYYDELHTVDNKYFLLDDATLFIDDSPYSQEYALNKNITVFSLVYPYNKHVEGVYFYDNLKDLIKNLRIWLELEISKKFVTIPVELYEELRSDSLFLSCLNGAGVDNWDGYEFAIDSFEELSKN